MPHSQVYKLDDPAMFRPAMRGGDIELLVMGRGKFRAEVTRIDLEKLWMQRGVDSLPRVVHATIDRRRAAIMFLGGAKQAAIQHDGLEFSPGEIAFYKTGATAYHRTEGASQFAAMSLTPDDLAAAAQTILGRELAPPQQTRVIRPAPAAMTHLVSIHARASRLAADAPATLAHPATAKALEHELVHTMISCLADEQPQGTRARAHARVMARFEDFLEARRYESVYLAEICAAARVSERTLRTCCQEYLGMGPIHYLWLRRMHLAHRALRSADPSSMTVTGVAMEYGFWELGRFSVQYHGLFGEAPSATLHRPFN